MSLNDYMDFFLWAFLVALAINIILRIINAHLESQLEAHQELLSKINDLVHEVKQEQVGDMVYWFDKDSNQFLAQGRTQEEIISVLRERFTKHIFLINEKEMLVGPEFKPVPVATLQK